MISQFTIFVCILFLFPTAHPVNAENMNYAVVAIGSLLVLVGTAWFAWGKDQYTGAQPSVSTGIVEEIVEEGAEKI